jgi:hypothetical protein
LMTRMDWLSGYSNFARRGPKMEQFEGVRCPRSIPVWI